MLILRDVIAGNIKAENGIDIQARVATVLRTGFGVGGESVLKTVTCIFY